MRTMIIAAAAIMAVSLSACDGNVASAPGTVKQTQSQIAQSAANSITFSGNAEIDNIKKRLTLTSDPGLLGYIMLINQTGQPILYEAVKGKVTSGNKRLTPSYGWVNNVSCGEYTCSQQVPAAGDDGTFGSSNDYIFYWNQQGQYRQWSGEYLYSDKPFRLTTQPLVINLTDTPADPATK